MTFTPGSLTLAAATAAALIIALTPASFAQDAMATDAMAADAMAMDATAPMSDDDLKLCLEQAGMISFATVMEAAAKACHDQHEGVMGDAMGGGAISAADGCQRRPGLWFHDHGSRGDIASHCSISPI